MADDLKDLLKRIENQNKQLESLIEENQRLAASPFDLTSIERLKILTEETKTEFNELKETLKDANDEIIKIGGTKYNNFFKKPKNILNDIKKLKKDIKDLRIAGDIDKAKDLEKILRDVTSKASSYYRTANREQEALNKRIVEGKHALDDFGEKWEQRTRAFRNGMSEVTKGGKQIFSSLKDILKPWADANQEAMTYARTMGMSKKTADAFLTNTVSWAAKNDIGLLFNKTTAELIKMQSKYSDVLGRNVQLTSEQKKDMLAMEKFLGEDGMIDIANNLENFGLGMSDSADFIKKTMDEATKHGIAASKLTKTIRENIKMAQSYTFKNGLDGLTNMAKKVVELKTNMSLINGFIEKTSTVEGAITTGANLQVLGGSYAAASDPLSMMYESLNNVEGLFDRALDMVKGKVFYNNKTGNFEMGAMDRYMMKQAATQMGINPEELINVAFRDASLSKIENAARSNKNNLDEDMIRMIKNVATWDKGKAVVDINGEKVNVDDLKGEHKAKLESMQRNDSQNLQEMSISLRSINEKVSGIEKEIQNEQAKATEILGQKLDKMLSNNTELLNNVAKIGAWKNIIGGGFGILGGVWLIASGVLRMGKGIGNIGRGFGSSTSKPGARGIGATNIKSGILRPGNWSSYTKGPGGFWGNENVRELNGKIYKKTGKGWQNINSKGSAGILKGKSVDDLLKNGKKVAGWKNLAKAAGKGLKVGGGTALIGAGLSLGTDIMTGEFKRDIEGSFGRAAGPALGSIIGGVFGGPVGAFIGGWAGQVITSSIQDSTKKARAKVREEIASRLESVTPAIAGLFTGPNALEGNYSKSQLKKLEEALADNVIDENDDLGWLLNRKLKNNNDLIKMQEQGVKVNIEMAKGGYLDGLRHHEGGMPILGSNISVEGGEFIVNRESTKVLRPYLERMNKGDYSMISKEPLGKQMSVHRSVSPGMNMPHFSKMNIEPISINISGTIKLDSGNRQLDITNELLNNPQLVSKLTDIITKQINILDNNAYNKGAFKQKFT